MNRDTAITSTSPEDLNAILSLLTEAALPQQGVHEHFHHFLVARADGRVIGAVEMERDGLSALLRSLAVAPEYRAQGLG